MAYSAPTLRTVIRVRVAMAAVSTFDRLTELAETAARHVDHLSASVAKLSNAHDVDQLFQYTVRIALEYEGMDSNMVTVYRNLLAAGDILTNPITFSEQELDDGYLPNISGRSLNGVMKTMHRMTISGALRRPGFYRSSTSKLQREVYVQKMRLFTENTWHTSEGRWIHLAHTVLLYQDSATEERFAAMMRAATVCGGPYKCEVYLKEVLSAFANRQLDPVYQDYLNLLGMEVGFNNARVIDSWLHKDNQRQPLLTLLDTFTTAAAKIPKQLSLEEAIRAQDTVDRMQGLAHAGFVVDAGVLRHLDGAGDPAIHRFVEEHKAGDLEDFARSQVGGAFWGTSKPQITYREFGDFKRVWDIMLDQQYKGEREAEERYVDSRNAHRQSAKEMLNRDKTYRSRFGLASANGAPAPPPPPPDFMKTTAPGGPPSNPDLLSQIRQGTMLRPAEDRPEPKSAPASAEPPSIMDSLAAAIGMRRSAFVDEEDSPEPSDDEFADEVESPEPSDDEDTTDIEQERRDLEEEKRKLAETQRMYEENERRKREEEDRRRREEEDRRRRQRDEEEEREEDRRRQRRREQEAEEDRLREEERRKRAEDDAARKKAEAARKKEEKERKKREAAEEKERKKREAAEEKERLHQALIDAKAKREAYDLQRLKADEEARRAKEQKLRAESDEAPALPARSGQQSREQFILKPESDEVTGRVSNRRVPGNYFDALQTVGITRDDVVTVDNFLQTVARWRNDIPALKRVGPKQPRPVDKKTGELIPFDQYYNRYNKNNESIEAFKARNTAWEASDTSAEDADARRRAQTKIMYQVFEKGFLETKKPQDWKTAFSMVMPNPTMPELRDFYDFCFFCYMLTRSVNFKKIRKSFGGAHWSPHVYGITPEIRSVMEEYHGDWQALRSLHAYENSDHYLPGAGAFEKLPATSVTAPEKTLVSFEITPTRARFAEKTAEKIYGDLRTNATRVNIRGSLPGHGKHMALLEKHLPEALDNSRYQVLAVRDDQIDRMGRLLAKPGAARAFLQQQLLDRHASATNGCWVNAEGYQVDPRALVHPKSHKVSLGDQEPFLVRMPFLH